MKKGEIVVKILQGGGYRTASFAKIKAVKKGIAFLGEGRKEDDVNAYDITSGRSLNNYMPGFSTYIVPLDGGEEQHLNKTRMCTSCGTEKPFSEFHKDNTRPAGVYPECKLCRNARFTQERPRHRPRECRHANRYRDKYPEKAVAKRTLRTAIKRGLLARPGKCSECGTVPPPRTDGRTQIHGHHHNGYDKPLDVVWLCPPCHINAHRATIKV